MRGNLISPSVVTRPFRPLGTFLKRIMGGARSRPPIPPQARQNGSDTERRLSFMLESVPVNLWSTDARLNITFSQGAGLHLIGTSANEMETCALGKRDVEPGIGRPQVDRHRFEHEAEASFGVRAVMTVVGEFLGRSRRGTPE